MLSRTDALVHLSLNLDRTVEPDSLHIRAEQKVDRVPPRM